MSAVRMSSSKLQSETSATGGVSQDTKEIAVRISLKNNRLRTARRARGMTVDALCDAASVHRSEYYALESFRRTPRLPNGTLRRTAARLCAFLKIDPVSVFPLDLDMIDGGTRELHADARELPLLGSQLANAGLSGGWEPLDPEQALALREELSLVLRHLTPRQEMVLSRRALGEPLEAIAAEYEVSVERVRRVGERAARRARDSYKPCDERAMAPLVQAYGRRHWCPHPRR